MIRKWKTLRIAGAFLVLSGTANATGWRVAKTGSATGEFAVKSVTADVHKPAGLAVRLIGHVNNGLGIVSCTKGSGLASWHRSYTRPGLYILPMTRGAESCTVLASVGGTGRVTVQILRR